MKNTEFYVFIATNNTNNVSLVFSCQNVYEALQRLKTTNATAAATAAVVF